MTAGAPLLRQSAGLQDAAEAEKDGLVISVVVVAFRQRDALAECIDSCLNACRFVEGETELIVVDNGDLSEFIRNRWAEAIVLKPGYNSGFAAAVNRAAAVAQGQWIALVNDDARIEAGALAALLTAGQSSSNLGSVAGQVRFISTPDKINSAGISVDRLGIAAERLVGQPVVVASSRVEVFGATGCFALYRRATFEELGGFDEQFFAYLEDVDLAWRARAKGWSCVYEPNGIAYHQGSATSRDGSATKFFLVGRNRVWLLARNATRSQLLRALPGVVLYDSAYVIYVALRFHALAPLRGRIAGLQGFRAARRETGSDRAHVELSRSGWRKALAMHRAYRSLDTSV